MEGQGILILGTGRVGTSLGRWLADHGNRVCWWNRTVPDEGSLAAFASAGVLRFQTGEPLPDFVVAPIPDSALAGLPDLLAIIAPGFVGTLLHCSGSAAADILGAWRGPHGRLHPLLPFTCRFMELGRVPGGPLFLIEGDPAACAVAEAVVASAGGRTLVAGPGFNPPLYHAACSMASNFPALLLFLADGLFRQAGLDGAKARLAAETLLSGSLFLAKERGAAGAVSGPAARNDKVVLRLHAAALASQPPDLQALYRELSSFVNTHRDLFLDGAEPKH